MLWVKRRGNLEDGGFQSKCNGPNGLSIELTNIQSLESYQLDDLPAEGGNAAAKRLCASALQPYRSKTGRRTASTRRARNGAG